MMEIEIDIMNDILDFNPVAPPRVWLDRVPRWMLHLCRRFFSKPLPTPREKWHLSLIFVKDALQLLIKERNEQKTLIAYGYDPKEFGKAGLN